MVAHVRDERTRHRRKMIIGALATLIIASAATYVVLVMEMEDRRARVARLRGRPSAYGSTEGFKRTPRWPDKERNSKWLLGYEESSWWQIISRLTASADEHPQLLKQFKAKTRVGWPIFQQLLLDMSRDATLRERQDVSIPLSMKLCASLRHLATGSSFDSMEDAFRVSVQVLRRFFWDKFIPWMIANKYSEVVRAPRTFDELARVVGEFEAAGFPGCAGSVDGTHVAWVGFRAGDRADMTGKEGYPTLVFGVTVDHSYKIMHITRAHPGATNDNVVMLEDEFHQTTMHSDLYKNFEFTLYDEDRRKVRHRGVYAICDGGYGDSRNLVSAFRNAGVVGPKLDWSRWVGSVRKDVECTFGVLKQRFRILYTHIARRKANDVENMFKVCAILHNLILERDRVQPSADGYAQYVNALQRDIAENDDGADLHEPAAYANVAAVGDIARSEHADSPQPDPALDRVGGASPLVLRKKRALQDALVVHLEHYRKIHRAEYGVDVFAYASSRENALRRMADRM